MAVGFYANGGGRKSVEHFACAVAVILGEAGNGDIEVEFVFDHFAYHFHLALSTVGNDEVWQFLSFFV